MEFVSSAGWKQDHIISGEVTLSDSSCTFEPGREKRGRASSLHCNLSIFLRSKLIFLPVSALSVQGFVVLSISCAVLTFPRQLI